MVDAIRPILMEMAMATLERVKGVWRVIISLILFDKIAIKSKLKASHKKPS